MSSLGKALRSTWNSVFGPNKQNRRRRAKALEAGDQLESRRLLATLVNTTTLTYQDIDGDNVTVKFSKPILTSQTTANTIFTFSTGFPGVTGSNALKQQLQSINLAAFATAAGTTITTTAVRSPVNGGDGFAAIGQIDATGRDLGAVTIDGDLGRILAGDAVTTTQGLGALKVHSLGRFGKFTGATNLTSSIQGPVASLTTRTDVVEAEFNVVGGVNGTMGAVTIGGSLIGGSAGRSGYIETTGNLGAVKITGNVRGGAGFRSGTIVGSKIASVTIGGSLVGAGGDESAEIYGRGDIGPVSILGNASGSTGRFSGIVYSDAKLASLTIGGSLIGGSGDFSGYVYAGSDMGAVKITGNLRGGGGTFSSGAIDARGKLASVTIGGSLIGSSGVASGQVFSQLDMGPVVIAGDVQGGSFSTLVENEASGAIISKARLASVTIRGSLIGGVGSFSGSIAAANELTTLTISGDIIGGSDSGVANLERSGSVSAGRIGALTLGGSLIAGTDQAGGTFRDNGAIRVTNDIASVTINGSIIGNTTNRAMITARGQLTPAGTIDLAIGKLTVNGRVEHALIHAGINPNDSPNGRNADAQIGPVIVGGDWITSSLVAGALAGVEGQFGTSDDVKISGSGAKDVATVFSKITSIVIGGQALGTNGGTDHFGFVAQNIGSFKVKGGTTTFPMIAGNGNDDFLIGLFGDLRVNEI